MLRLQLLSRFSCAVIFSAVSFGYPLNQAVNVVRQNPLFPLNNYTNVQGTPAPGVSGTFSSGIFGLKYDVLGAPEVYTPFSAICVDASEYLFSTNPTLHYVQSFDDYPANVSDPAPDNTPDFTPLQRELLEKLFTIGWQNAQLNGTNAAAFQWAAWEIARDTQSAPLSLSNGNVTITNDNAVRQKANVYLSAIQTDTIRTPLVMWSPVIQLAGGGFQRIAGQELLTPVPEPGYLALLAGGFGALIYIRRRQMARKQV